MNKFRMSIIFISIFYFGCIIGHRNIDKEDIKKIINIEKQGFLFLTFSKKYITLDIIPEDFVCAVLAGVQRVPNRTVQGSAVAVPHGGCRHRGWRWSGDRSSQGLRCSTGAIPARWPVLPGHRCPWCGRLGC